MSKLFVIEAEKREAKGKAAAKILRRDKKIPGVVYGSGIDPVKITVDHKSLTKRYLEGHFKTQICQIEVGGQKIKTLPKIVNLHPVSDEIVHIDFFKPNRKYKLKLLIPIHFLNEDKCIGIKTGGVLNVASREVEILCTIDNIPESFDLDIETLEIGSTIHQSAIKLPEDVEFSDKENDPAVISAAHPVAEVEEEEEASVDDVVVDSEKDAEEQSDKK
ncbi:MAG: 50S ribosomal protein L25/general stress protein Ctc [Rickettsiales bacterium]|jgi:large subunit ribosomal protein L25|nr:50S ribosomal protein L25/general stress protein Ctc [Rickettsiales bacterium]